MSLVGRKIGAALVLVAACCAPAFGAQPPAKGAPAKPALSKPATIQQEISIAVNGEDLAQDPAPKVVGKGGGRLVVPVVKIYSALGIAVSRDGNTLTASAPGKRIVIRIGSAQATIDNRPVLMELPAMTIDGATYVPLRFVADSLGAQVNFDAKANRVEVTSSLVGRNPSLEQRGTGGASQVVGTVDAVDFNSAPQSITVTRGTNVRTVSITSDAHVELQDVVARTSTPGSLTDVHTGDAISIIVRGDGHVDAVLVRYASRSGTIAAVSPTAFVLNSGFVVTLDKSTVLTVNGSPATLADLKVGDSVLVRLNPDTNEKRQILVARAIPPTPQASAEAVAISAFTVSARGAVLRAGDTLDVSLKGTPGGRATYDIGSYVTGLPLTESASGSYTGRYTVPPAVNFGQTSIYGHLNVGGVDAARAETRNLVSVSNTPPQIVEIAPSGGQNVNNSRPSIYATFRSPIDVGIAAGSETISINGQDVSASATRTEQFITYSPSVALADGPVAVTVHVTDKAGNSQTRSWTFTIRTH